MVFLMQYLFFLLINYWPVLSYHGSFVFMDHHFFSFRNCKAQVREKNKHLEQVREDKIRGESKSERGEGGG